jgi:gas vesicle protein
MNSFLLGLGVGLTVGMLFAPKSGPETRDYISTKANEGTDYLLKQGQQLKDSASDLLERGKNIVTSQRDQVKGMEEEARHQVFQR